MKLRLLHPMRLGLALALLTAPASYAEISDAWVTTRAKLALLTADDVSVTAVNVDTVEGNVTLHGKVKTEAERERAAAVVRSLEGVKRVQNLLQVVPDAFKHSMNIADSTIKDGVEASLRAAAELKDVKVASVNNGVVLLSGTTDSLSHKLQALETAYRVPGVRRVASEIRSEKDQ